jgi:hypothetical protein
VSKKCRGTSTAIEQSRKPSAPVSREYLDQTNGIFTCTDAHNIPSTVVTDESWDYSAVESGELVRGDSVTAHYAGSNLAASDSAPSSAP